MCFVCDVCIHTVNYGLGDKTIPEIFGSLLSLRGLFLGTLICNDNECYGRITITYINSLILLRLISLGGNQLIGTIPSQLGSIQKLQMLWLGKCRRRHLLQVLRYLHQCCDLYLNTYMFVFDVQLIIIPQKIMHSRAQYPVS